MPADLTGLYRVTTNGAFLQVIPHGDDLAARVFDADLQDAMLPTPVPRAQIDHVLSIGAWERCDGPWLGEEDGVLVVQGAFDA